MDRDPKLKNDDSLVIGGAGRFIGGSLARYLRDLGFTRIRDIDKKPVPEWYRCVPGAERLTLDLSSGEKCRRCDELLAKPRFCP